MYALQLSEGVFQFLPCNTLTEKLLTPSMDLSRDSPPLPNRRQTSRGTSLLESENSELFYQLGQDVLLFSEWCQHHSSLKRRSYLVVVNELTRIIHNEFKEAHIEVRVIGVI